MERIHYRSTSTTDIQAELRQRELIAEARGRLAHPIRRRAPYPWIHQILRLPR